MKPKKTVDGPGYVYVLKNKAYADFTLKIGFTTKEPSRRAKEIYQGATGVPEHFDVAVAFSVGNCRQAEKEIHHLFKAYRLNKRREFFKITPNVAESTIHACCLRVNESLGMDAPERYEIDKFAGRHARVSVEDGSNGQSSDANVLKVPLKAIRQSPLHTSSLTSSQVSRIEIIGGIFQEVFPDALSKWVESFTRDNNPENELVIWEAMAKAFMSIDQLYAVGNGLKDEAFFLLLSRSWKSTDEVLKETSLKHMTIGSARRLLGEYDLKPQPLKVRIGNT